MMCILWLLACGSSPDQGSPPDRAATAPTPTTEPEEQPLALLSEASGAGPRLEFSGAAASCEGDLVWLGAEYKGELDALKVTPWVGGTPGAPIPLPDHPSGGLFRLSTLEATVQDCANATWVWEAESASSWRCLVTGPGAVELLPALPEGCISR